MKDVSRWDINVVYPGLPSYVKGRVALLGDAVSLTVFLEFDVACPTYILTMTSIASLFLDLLKLT